MGKSLQARFDEIELLSAISQYTNFLKPLYTDISFEDLAVTASDLYGTNLTPEQIANSFASDCEHEKKLVREERVKTNVDLANLETEGPFLWLKRSLASTGNEMCPYYNECCPGLPAIESITKRLWRSSESLSRKLVVDQYTSLCILI